jgi:hypothetical protein
MFRITLFLCCIVFLFSPKPAFAQTAYEDILKAVQVNDLPAVQTLLSRGMEVDTADQDGNSLLMIAAREGHLELVRFLVGQKANLDARNRFGETAIMLASLKGKIHAVIELSARGAKIAHSGWTPLHYCAWEGKADICQFLIVQGAPVNARAPNGSTPLMLAASQGHVEAVKLLLSHSADHALQNEAGITALSLALKAGHTDIADLLRSVTTKQ